MTQNQWRDKSGRSISGIVSLRILCALIVVLATWNPSGYSYLEWVLTSLGSNTFWDAGVPKLLVGALLATGWLILLYQTHRWFGRKAIAFGLVIIAVLFAFFELAARLEMSRALMGLMWTGLVGTSIVLGFGAAGRSLKNLKRRLDQPRYSRRS